MTNINTIIEKYLFNHKILGHTDSTLIHYKDFLYRFVRESNIKYLEDINIDVIEKYASVLFERNLSKSTVATYLRHVKAFIHWLEDNGYLEDKTLHSKIKLPKSPKKLLKIYSDDEIKLIYNKVVNKPLWIEYRNKLVISLMLDSGLRQNEVCTILKDNVNIVEHFIKVYGKGDKERIVPIGKTTMYYMNEYLTCCPYTSNELLLSFHGGSLDKNAVKLFIRKLQNKIGFEISSHKLRHNFATNYCLDQYNQYGNIDIYRLMVLLGHEDIKTTRRYLHIANQYIACKTNVSHLDRLCPEIV